MSSYAAFGPKVFNNWLADGLFEGFTCSMAFIMLERFLEQLSPIFV
jgi:hypothetical protein